MVYAVELTSAKSGSRLTRLRCLFLLATAFSISYWMASITNISEIAFKNGILWNEIKYDLSESYNQERFTIQTKGCNIPFLTPLSPAIEKYVQRPTQEICPNDSLSLLGSNRSHVWINEGIKNLLHITDEDTLECCYQSFYRPISIDNVTSLNNDERVKYNKCQTFTEYIAVNDEFVRIRCMVNDTEIYQQFFLFAIEKDIQNSNAMNTNYNVIVMGIDAVSRLNFHRTMPKTLAYLKNKGAVELLGYNKVGDNTFPNLVPMLMGISVQELKRTCMPNSQSTFDNCPIIWNWYKEAGYKTAFGEDSSKLGTFNYVQRGFLRRPTDFYIHTFMNEAENHVGKDKNSNTYLCMNEKYFYKVLLDYVENILETLKFTKLFGFFWEVSLSHDYLNYPMLMDNKYESFLKSLDDKSYFNNTILFLVSDHGIRWGGIRSTKQGRLEERLPFVYILLPDSFQDNYSDAYHNIKANRKRLTTPYDIHATLTDLLDMKMLENGAVRTRKQRNYALQRGISLFLPIPINRTCTSASIDDHWCTCLQSRNILTSDIEAIEVAVQLIQKLNMLILQYKQCIPLKLIKIIEVNEIELGSPDTDEIGWREYMAVIKTQPGDGIFEATLRKDKQGWTLVGSISRLNLYGEQSRCMHNYQLKLYCFCS